MKQKLEALWRKIDMSVRQFVPGKTGWPPAGRGAAEARQEAKRAAYLADPTRGTGAREIARRRRQQDRIVANAVKRSAWHQGRWTHLSIPLDQP